MRTLTLHTIETAPDGSREALRGLERNIGFIPNLAATIGGSPTAIEGFVALQTSLRGSTLTPLEREVVGVTVSRFNSCEYSIAAHSTFARSHGAGEDLLSGGEALDDPRHEALRAFTVALLDGRGHVSDEGLRDAGYSAEQVLEVLTQVAYTTLANHVANVAEPPVDAAFRVAMV